MKNLKTLFLILFFLPVLLFSQNNIRFEKTTTFFPDEKIFNNQNIDWGFLLVPENYEKPQGKFIKIAVAILRHTSKSKKSQAIVYIAGGPGAGGIDSIWGWLKNPLREDHDIVLLDVRGTGFSFPKFCPDLGKKFLEILSKNQNSTVDEQQKVIASMDCRNDLISRGIEIEKYNSESIAKDLNNLKEVLRYNKWTVYSVSYGTYMAQVYANDFSQDIESLILDSPISDIAQYYNNNSSNYITSLKKVFDECKADPNCNRQYPNLENTYYQTIEKIAKKPITVQIDKKVLPSGKFTYNVEDFKISIQQALYHKKLIEILPLLITEFNKENKNTLSALVTSFSGAFELDYGAYYCISCNEAIPFNSLAEFNKNASIYKGLNGGLSFYKSDFLVCEKWNSSKNEKKRNVLSNLPSVDLPVMVFSGKFDPITPLSNGQATAKLFKKAFLITGPTYAHGSSFTLLGNKIAYDFIQNPNVKPGLDEFQSNRKINFITDIFLSKGISNFAKSLNNFNFLFFAPLFIASIVLIFAIFCFTYLFVKKVNYCKINKIMGFLIILTSVLGLSTIIAFILAINNAANQNFYILAFGIPAKFRYIYLMQWIYISSASITTFYFFINMRKIFNSAIIFTILFSILLFIVYFQYWGLLF